MQVIDVIDLVRDHRDQERGLEQIEGIALHRAGINLTTEPPAVLGYDGPTVAQVFTGKVSTWRDIAEVTGRQNAYTFLCASDCGPYDLEGRVWQALPLEEVGWHARRHSVRWIGLTWIADPRVRPLSSAAYQAGLEVVGALCNTLELDPLEQVKGHGEIPGSHDGDKAPGEPEACPGLSQGELDAFRGDVGQWMVAHPEVGAEDLGVVISR